MKKTIALCMVVKNEEKGLAKAIESCKAFVDEIHILVDDSCIDKTFDIANKYTNYVKSFKWEDDFSKARNLACENVKSDWVLFIDGHEFVSRADRLQEALNLDCDVLIPTIRMESGFEFQAPRIYKNGLKFVGAVHEQLEFKKPATFNTFVIQHDRENGQDKKSALLREEQRDEQLPRILLNRFKCDKKDVRASFHLMLHFQTKGDYRRALKYAKYFLKYAKNAEQRWFVYYTRCVCFMALNRSFRAFMAISRADLEVSNRWETEKMKGVILFSSGKIEKALKCLVNSFDMPVKNHIYKPLPRDDAGTWNLIGECYYKRGIYDKASISFKNASENTEDKVQKGFFQMRSGLMSDMINGREN